MRIGRLRAGEEARLLAAASLFDSPVLEEEAARRFLADAQNYLLVAYLEEQPVGFAVAYELLRYDRATPMMFLYEIGVAEGYRRRGVARGLIQELERISRERGFQEMFVITNASNGPAMRLYEATGGVREAEDDVVFVYSYGLQHE